MSAPTEQEYRRAQDAGAAARRAGKRRESNPHTHDHTERGGILAEAWWIGFDEEAARR